MKNPMMGIIHDNTVFHSDEFIDVNYESQPDKLASCFLRA